MITNYGEGKEIIKMAIANFENIEKIAGKLTSGNVSHDGATIKGIAHRNAEYLKKHLSAQNTQEKQVKAKKAFCLQQCKTICWESDYNNRCSDFEEFIAELNNQRFEI